MNQIKEKTWVDEQGIPVPVSFIGKDLKFKEKLTGEVLKRALKLNGELRDFKLFIKEGTDEAMRLFREKNAAEGKPKGKGNFTIFNFDRSIKLSVDISENISFDNMKMGLAQERLMHFIEAGIIEKKEGNFIKTLVMSAFETSKGNFDVKKITPLQKYKEKIKDEEYHSIMDLISSAMTTSYSCTYYRIWQRMEDGKYESIDLNFSSI